MMTASDFQSAMIAAGITPPADILVDGKLHRFHLADERNGRQSGWYKAYPDDPPCIVFGDWREGESHKWCAKNGDMTADERARYHERIEQARRERESEQAAEHEQAAAEAARIWEAASPADPTHPYLARKGVQPHGIRQDNGKLIIPVRTPVGALVGLQFIGADGTKRFLSGTAMRGNCFVIGDAPYVLCEGPATGFSIREATGYGVVVAFCAGNLLPVAKAVRPAIVAGDNDRKTKGNPGITKATTAADATGARIVVPEFGPDETGTDWNDFAAIHGLDAVKAALVPETPAAGTQLANYSIETDPTTGKQKTRRIKAPSISREMFQCTDNWPRRADRVLFVDEGVDIRWLATTPDLFAWLDEHFSLFWKGGNALLKNEYHSHVLAKAQAYAGVETQPHEPQIAGLYYNWKPPEGYTPDGSHLNRLVSFFQNIETAGDGNLIKAMFCTPAWGGPHGTRPAFIKQAPDRGCGKTTLAEAVGALYGGHIAVDPGDRGEDRLVSRLLTLSAWTRRVVLVDNMKEIKSSALIEGLITGRTISGHMFHVGNAERPNTLTWLFTGNTVQLSRDLADRAFIIHLTKPTSCPGWRESLFGYIEEHRDRILADVLALLRSKPQCTGLRDRWQSWVDGVLSRVTPHAAVLVELNQERRDSVDVDLDEAGEILAEVKRHMNACNPCGNFIASVTMTKIVNEALGVHFSTRKAVSVVKGHIEAGRLQGITHERTREARGFYVV